MWRRNVEGFNRHPTRLLCSPPTTNREAYDGMLAHLRSPFLATPMTLSSSNPATRQARFCKFMQLASDLVVVVPSLTGFLVFVAGAAREVGREDK